MIGEVAARSFKHCSLEMGGKNATIIMEDANLDLAADGVLWGAFGTSGQRCTATGPSTARTAFRNALGAVQHAQDALAGVQAAVDQVVESVTR